MGDKPGDQTGRSLVFVGPICGGNPGTGNPGTDGTFPSFLGTTLGMAEARRPRFAPVQWMFSVITPVFRALTWVSPYSDGRQAYIVLRQQGPLARRILRFPIWESTPQPVHFPVDLISSFPIL